MQPLECKICGLLKTTIDECHVNCINNGHHHYQDKTFSILQPLEQDFEQRLLYEVMENYIITAEFGHFAKDQVKHREEMRRYWKDLIDFITTEKQKSFEDGLRRAREVLPAEKTSHIKLICQKKK